MSQEMPRQAAEKDPAVPARPGLKVGVDEWVAQVEGRTRRYQGGWGRVAYGWQTIPLGVRYALAILIIFAFPFVTATDAVLDGMGIASNDFLVRIGARFLIFAMLAIGLNVVVGYCGLLDLGYVAFFGIAGYSYAYLSSDFIQFAGLNGVHLPSILSLPLIVLWTALIGLGVGYVAFRFGGDYLAIVTLGFGQVFLQLALTATRVQLPWTERPVDLTRGPNGINRLDDLAFFGFQLETTTHYYLLAALLLIFVYAAVHHLNQSRIGRAWRALKDDELAAEVMGIPTWRMKLLAFAIGAGIAGLAGAVDTAWQDSVIPNPRYSVLTLINLYAMVVLGGLGSLPGVVLGALIFTTLPEILRDIQAASAIFYGGLIFGLLLGLRPWKRLAAVVVSTLALGFVIRFVGPLLLPNVEWLTGGTDYWLNEIVHSWLLIPADFVTVGNIVTIGAIVVLLAAMVVAERWRWAVLSIALYMFIFAWETRLVQEPAATRILIVGTTLVVLMVVRPQGLLGKPEVRVV
ncbi:MAG: branched-chain amino acid ABC transporter permease [Litorilinea sp.]